MPYTIQIIKGPSAATIVRALETQLAADKRFTVHFAIKGNKIHPQEVRRAKPEPYCGNHPGKCVVESPRRRLAFLEWADWIAFHGLVNDVLDALHVSADVWSVPGEPVIPGTGNASNHFFIRRGPHRRVHYDWDEVRWKRTGGSVVAVRRWNYGSEDQFAA